MLNAFDAEVTVTVCSAAASDTVVYGTCRPGPYTSGACTSSAITRAPCRSTSAASSRELLRGEHPPGRVVRVAQQHGAGTRPQRRFDAVEIQGRSAAHGRERGGDDLATGELDDLEERRVGRRGNDDLRTGCDEHVERGRDAGEHVGDGEDPGRRDDPPVLGGEELGAGRRELGEVGLDVAEVLARRRPRGAPRAPPARRRSPSPPPRPPAPRARRASTSPCGADGAAPRRHRRTPRSSRPLTPRAHDATVTGDARRVLRGRGAEPRRMAR